MTQRRPDDDTDPVLRDRVVVVPGQQALPFEGVSDDLMQDMVAQLLAAVVLAYVNNPWVEDCPFD